ncbi:MAG: Crp/Fnr family transcriptional regulator [Arcanobacterium sp.]|nr:Crp/Fnr family transcriptional regulator [Arcanobacterium sp.]
MADHSIQSAGTTPSRAHAEDSPTCVAVVPIFKGLTLAEQLEVAQVARPTLIERGTTVFRQGESLGKLMVLHSGSVKLMRTLASGHEHLVRVLGAGDFMGEWAFLKGGRAKHTAVTLETTHMCVFDHRDLATVFRTYPSVGLRMLTTLTDRLADTEERLVSAISADVGARLASYLLSLPSVARDSGVFDVQLPIAKKEIAALLDTTPESLSRQLRAFEKGGLIESRGKTIRLLDVDKLLDMAPE